jgi:hypothetical protein
MTYFFLLIVHFTNDTTLPPLGGWKRDNAMLAGIFSYDYQHDARASPPPHAIPLGLYTSVRRIQSTRPRSSSLSPTVVVVVAVVSPAFAHAITAALAWPVLQALVLQYVREYQRPRVLSSVS